MLYCYICIYSYLVELLTFDDAYGTLNELEYLISHSEIKDAISLKPYRLHM